MTISCTYAPTTEITNLTRLTHAQEDAAVDAGQLVLVHDGTKAKVSRGVNSLQTTTGKGDCYKKIKLVELMDMIRYDIRTTGQDSYIGKYANTYDNKCLLLTAIRLYFQTLEREGLLKSGASTVGIDMEAQRTYIASLGVDPTELDDATIKQYNTGSQVFLTASIVPIDAIEDIAVNILLDEVS